MMMPASNLDLQTFKFAPVYVIELVVIRE